MTRRDEMKIRARMSAEKHGHKLDRFTNDGKNSAYAYCLTGCGMAAFVDSDPVRHGIEYHGRAVSEDCPNADLPGIKRIKPKPKGKTPTFAECSDSRCGHIWPIVYLPMDMTKAARCMKAPCPMCGCTTTFLAT